MTLLVLLFIVAAFVVTFATFILGLLKSADYATFDDDPDLELWEAECRPFDQDREDA